MAYLTEIVRTRDLPSTVSTAVVLRPAWYCRGLPFSSVRKSKKLTRRFQSHISIEKREPTFLANKDWVEIPFVSRAKQRRDRLLDIATHIPDLLHRTDEVLANLTRKDTACGLQSKSPSDHSRPFEAVSGLLDDIARIRLDLQDWLDSLRKSFSKPLYWWCNDKSIPEYAYPVDPQCVPDLQNPSYQLRFPEGQKAGLLVTYWSYVLELLAAVIEIQTALGHVTSIDVPPSMIEDLNSNRIEGDHTALLITQAEPYLTSCLEGKTVIHFPLRVASRYLARWPRARVPGLEATKQADKRPGSGLLESEAWTSEINEPPEQRKDVWAKERGSVTLTT